MRREISSSTQTDFYQYSFIIFLFVLFLILIANLASLSRNLFELASYLLASLTISVVFIKILFKLKRVEIVEEKKGLIVQTTSPSSSKRILVPFENIKNVTQIPLLSNPEIVTIELHRYTDFGNKIRFIPKIRFFAFDEHPIVAELNQKITQHHLSN